MIMVYDVYISNFTNNEPSSFHTNTPGNTSIEKLQKNNIIICSLLRLKSVANKIDSESISNVSVNYYHYYSTKDLFAVLRTNDDHVT